MEDWVDGVALCVSCVVDGVVVVVHVVIVLLLFLWFAFIVLDLHLSSVWTKVFSRLSVLRIPVVKNPPLQKHALYSMRLSALIRVFVLRETTLRLYGPLVNKI